MILYGLVVFIHIIVCFVLIAVILLQAGRGGGLAEPFGGSATKTIFGTKAATFLTRATSVAAVVFIFTCLTLGVLNTRKSRSLIDRTSMQPVQQIPSLPMDIPFDEKIEQSSIPPLAADEGAEGQKEEASASLPEGTGAEESQPVSVPAEE